VLVIGAIAVLGGVRDALVGGKRAPGRQAPRVGRRARSDAGDAGRGNRGARDGGAHRGVPRVCHADNDDDVVVVRYEMCHADGFGAR
jgi:hypothetical protein